MAIINFPYQPNQPYLYFRQWSIALSRPGQPAASVYTQLRIQFEIEKLALGTSSKAKISIYNLSQQSRGQIGKGWNVLLKAGYTSNVNLPTIFLGVVGYNGAYSKRDGADIITTFECNDGGPSLIFGKLDKSYSAGTSAAQVLQDLVSATALGVGVVTGIPAFNFSKGFTVHGSISESLTKLCSKLGLAWSINGGNVNIIPIKGYNGLIAEQLSVDTGMIGVPSVDNGLLKATSLLNPRVFPGGLVNLTAENQELNGVYKVNKVKIEGDSHDDKWQQEIEAIKFPNASATTPNSSGANFGNAVITT